MMYLGVLLALLYGGAKAAGPVPFTCTRRVGTEVTTALSSVSCEAGETLVSCGIDGWNNVYGTYIDPASPNQCTVGQNFPAQNGNGVSPVAVCCTFPTDAIESVTTIVSTTPASQIITTCPDDTVLTGCQVNLETGATNNIRGSYSGPAQGFFDTAGVKPAQVDTPQISTENRCVSEARTSASGVRGGAQCLKPSCGYELNCVTSGVSTSGNSGSTTNFDGNCPADYTLVECSTFTPTATLDDWHLTSTGGCYVQQDSLRPQYALSICCQLIETDGEECCAENYNVQILIDESGSVGQSNFDMSIAFVKDLINNDIDPDAPLSVFSFGNEDKGVDIVYRFNDDQSSRAGVMAALDAAQMDFDAGITPTRLALQTGIDEYNRAINANDLAEGARLVFLLTDGRPCCDQKHEPCEDLDGNPDTTISDQLDAIGAKVIVLGVGDFDTTPLACVADEIYQEASGFSSATFDALEAAFEQELCDADDPFELAPEPLNCDEAQEFCKNQYGTNLATIRTGADRAAAIQILNEKGIGEAWIGLYSDDIETYWQFRSGATCPSDSAYKCVDFWLTNPGGEAFRPRCIGPTEGGSGCATFYPGPNGVDNDAPVDAKQRFLCDRLGAGPIDTPPTPPDDL